MNILHKKTSHGHFFSIWRYRVAESRLKQLDFSCQALPSAWLLPFCSQAHTHSSPSRSWSGYSYTARMVLPFLPVQLTCALEGIMELSPTPTSARKLSLINPSFCDTLYSGTHWTCLLDNNAHKQTLNKVVLVLKVPECSVSGLVEIHHPFPIDVNIPISQRPPSYSEESQDTREVEFSLASRSGTQDQCLANQYIYMT